MLLVGARPAQPSPIETRIEAAKSEALKALGLSGLTVNLVVFHEQLEHKRIEPDGTEVKCLSTMKVINTGIDVSVSGQNDTSTITAIPIADVACEKCPRTGTIRIVQRKWNITLSS